MFQEITGLTPTWTCVPSDHRPAPCTNYSHNAHFDKWDAYAYKDAAQEKKRLIAITTEREKNKSLAAEKAKERAKKKKANAAWSETIERQNERLRRKEKKQAKAKWLRANAKAQQGGEKELGGPTKRGREDGSEDDDEDDWDDLAKEERMAKKVKKGEVSQQAFDAEFGDL